LGLQVFGVDVLVVSVVVRGFTLPAAETAAAAAAAAGEHRAAQHQTLQGATGPHGNTSERFTTIHFCTGILRTHVCELYLNILNSTQDKRKDSSRNHNLK